MTRRLHLVPPDGDGPHIRGVNPHEQVWVGDHFMHAVVPDERVTGCGFELPDNARVGRACDFPYPGVPVCPAIECFGDE